MENVSRDIKLIGGPDEVSYLRTTQYNMYFSLSHENIEIWKIIVNSPIEISLKHLEYIRYLRQVSESESDCNFFRVLEILSQRNIQISEKRMVF